MKMGVLKIKGLDAKRFLQGQLTCHMDQIAADKNHLAAHCNPQGRVVSLFYITAQADGYGLMMPERMLAIAMAGLKKYAVFFKVTMEIDSSTIEVDVPANEPVIYPETSGLFTPHEINLDQLNAISFDKGCYTGQEIIARMHYRGKLKKRMYQAMVETATPPVPGDSLQPEGTIVCCTFIDGCSYRLLVVCNDDDATNGLALNDENKSPLNF